jgi:hypothetical protein
MRAARACARSGIAATGRTLVVMGGARRRGAHELRDPATASFCGPEVPVAAQYAFERRSSALSLEPSQADPCADRDSILTGTWRRG